MKLKFKNQDFRTNAGNTIVHNGVNKGMVTYYDGE